MAKRPRRDGLALIGGYGKMGQWILQFLSRCGILDGLSVTITGPREEVGRKIAQRFGCTYSPDNAEAAKSKYVVITTPLDVAPSVLREVAPLLRRGTVLMDICSVKSEICSEARKHVGPGIEYVSLHPMFGPSVRNLEGQVIVVVPVGGGRSVPRLRAFLEGQQARVITATPQVHDYALGVVQCLTHFAYISVGSTLKDLDFDIKQSRSFSSPVYELMLDMIGRILSGDPMMYAEIQMSNPYSAEIEELFLRNATRLKDAVDSRDAGAFIRIMIEAGKHYDDLDSAFSKSGRAVSALYEEYLKIKGSVGKRVALRNEVTGAIHVGLLKAMTTEVVTIGDGKRTKRLKTSNVSLLPPEETHRQRIEKHGTAQRDVSFIFPEHADPEVVARMMKAYDEGLVSCSVVDVYTGKGIPKGCKSTTFRLMLFGDLDPDAAEARIRGLLTAMGASER